MTLDLGLEHSARSRGLRRKSKSAESSRDPLHALPEGLTAGELIALLEDLDPATPVVIGGQYGGFESARAISKVPLRFDVNRMEGFGPHDRASPDEPPDAVAVAVMVRSQPG